MAAATTRTGNFPIGFRRGWSDWQKGSIENLGRWAKQNDFAALDLMNITPADVKTLTGAGVKLGSVDLLDFGSVMSTDAAKRKDVIERNVTHVRQLAGAGAKAFFTCIIPGDPGAKRADNYKLAVECFGPIARACQEHGTTMVIEGYPGGPPYVANLCCTPETLRAFLKDVGPGAGVNYDPSHLIRLGVDHVRFLREFAPHVKHVHAKDTQLIPDAAYEFGSQASAFAKPHGFGEWTWRYTLPGHGEARWAEIFSILKDSGYSGVVSIELEDENFNGSEEGEKKALIYSRDFLASV
jgi:sugar phosphate isomerase/epimerase